MLVFVGRKKLPDGRRVALSTRLSESLAAEVDDARGGQTRSAWLEQAVRSHLAGDAASAESDRLRERAERLEEALADANEQIERLEASQCRHPSGAVEGGYCHACGQEA